MHLKRYRLLVSTLLSLASIAPAAEETTASAIAAKHYQALVADMSAYVEANPAATDLEEALDAGLQAAYLLEDTDRMLWFTRRKFDVLKVQEPLPVQDLAQTAMIYAQFASQGGSKDLLKGFLEELKTIATKSDSPIFPQVIQQVEGIVNKPGVGEVLEIKGISTEGAEIDLANMKGKVVLVDFWATWCGPCIKEMPNVKATYDEFHDKGFEVIGISIDQSLDPLKKFITQEKLAWPTLWDPGQRDSMAEKYSITSIPSLFLIGKDGKIGAVNSRGSELRKQVERLLAAE